MTLKEQLRAKAALVEERESGLRARQEREEQFFGSHTAPALRFVADYFHDVVRDLETIRPIVCATFPIGAPSRPDIAFDQSRHRIFVDNAAMPRQVSVNGTCEMARPLTRAFTGLREADEYEQLLRDMGITYHRRRQSDLSIGQGEASRFIVEGAIQAGFSLSADLPGERIRIEMLNLEDRPLRVYLLAPDRIDESLCDALGRVLLREQSQLLSTEVHDELRQLLRNDVLKLQREREIELAYGLAEQEEAARQRASQSLQGQVGEKLKVVTKQLKDAVKELIRSR